MAGAAQAQYTTVTGSKLQDLDGTKLTGQICFAPANNKGVNIGFRVGGGGQATVTKKCTTVTNGAYSVSVADTSLTNPLNVCYMVTATNSKGEVVLGPKYGYRAGQLTGYECVQPTGATWGFDDFTPAAQPGVVQVAGPTGPIGPRGYSGVGAVEGLTSDGAKGIDVEGKVKASSINGVINASTCNPAWSPNIPSWCAGPDIGAWINAAYAALPASGGIIQVTVPAEGLSFSTPIAISTQSKGAIIECVGDQGVAGTDPIHGLTYTGASGSAITFNFSGNGNSHQRGAGVRDCTLLGSGGTSTGIYLGGSQGAEGISIDHAHISGFGSAQIQFGDNVWMTEINHSILSGDRIHPLLIASGTSNLGENLNFSNTTFIYGTMNGDIAFSAGAGGTQANFWGCSFDNAQIVNNGAVVNLFAPHFENPGGPINAPYVINAGRMNITNPQFFNNSSLTTATSMVKTTAGDLTIIGGDFSSLGYSYPALFELSGSANFYELAPLSLNGSNNALPISRSSRAASSSCSDGNGPTPPRPPYASCRRGAARRRPSARRRAGGT
jgi:hypothetical protein